MKIAYKIINVGFALIGMILCLFFSAASIGTPEGLNKAAKVDFYGVFLSTLFFSTTALLIYSGIIFGINRFVFAKVSHPIKIFKVSMIVYFLLVVILSYLVVRNDLNIREPNIQLGRIQLRTG